jgi:hypothetical protein
MVSECFSHKRSARSVLSKLAETIVNETFDNKVLLVQTQSPLAGGNGAQAT